MWSALITVCAIAIASNLDNAGVGIAYGVRKIHISWLANALIAVISGIATSTAGLVGHVITHYVSSRAASWTGATVMLIVGLWVVLEPYRNRLVAKKRSSNRVSLILRDPIQADVDNSQTISLGEALILGVALALNALAGGFDAGVAHIGVTVTAIAVAIFSFILLGLSVYAGRRYAADALGDKATFIAGLLLILIGVHQIW